MRVLKIAIFHCGFVYSGGGERIVLEQVRGLKKKGYEIVVHAPTIDEKLCYPKLIKKLKVRTFLPSFIKWLPFRDALRMTLTSLLAPILAFKFQDVDVFIGANQPGTWIAFCMAKVLKKPYLVYLNQPNRLIYPRRIDRETGWQNRKDYYLLVSIIKLIKPFIAWADRISVASGKSLLVNGSYIGDIIKEAYKQRVVFCPGGVYLQTRNKLQLSPEAAFKGKFKLGKFVVNKPYILISNRHEPQKRFDYTIKAFKKVLEKYLHVELLIPGSFTRHTPELIALARKLKVLDRVKFIGQISEKSLQKLYQQAAVYAYPAPEEDFGLGPLEAGSWGVPAVAWNNAGPATTIVNGKTGYLAKPYDVSDYAEKILLLLLNPKKRLSMGRAVWQHAKNNFSWDKHIGILEKEIKKAINK